MIKVFIGYDNAERVAASVLAHSIHMHASEPVAVTPIMLSQLHGVFDRPRNDLQSRSSRSRVSSRRGSRATRAGPSSWIATC